MMLKYLELIILKQKKKKMTNDAKEKIKLYNTSDSLEALIENKISAVVWNKIYKKEIIENIYFKVGKLHEDEFWSYHVFGNAKKIVMSSLYKYYYRQHKDSIMGEKYNIRRLDAIEAKKERISYLEKNYPSLVNKAKINYLLSCIYHGQLILKNKSNENNNLFDQIKQYYKCIMIKKIDSNELPIKTKIWLYIGKYNLKFACFARNFMKIGL